jgi:hypothetical protein
MTFLGHPKEFLSDLILIPTIRSIIVVSMGVPPPKFCGFERTSSVPGNLWIDVEENNLGRGLEMRKEGLNPYHREFFTIYGFDYGSIMPPVYDDYCTLGCGLDVMPMERRPPGRQQVEIEARSEFISSWLKLGRWPKDSFQVLDPILDRGISWIKRIPSAKYHVAPNRRKVIRQELPYRSFAGAVNPFKRNNHGG